MDVGAVPDHGKQQGAAGSAAGVVCRIRIAVDQGRALGDPQAIPSDAGERFEGGTGGSAALGTVAVQCVNEPVSDLVGDGAA